MKKKPEEGHWQGVIGFTGSTPLGIEAPTYPSGRVIPHERYSRDLPGHEEFFPEVANREAEKERWANVARIAYRRFPALGKGESIRSSELSARLSELRKVGYEVPPYSRMTKDEKWELLQGIKRDVNEQVRVHGAGYVLAEIAQRNEQLREEEKYLR